MGCTVGICCDSGENKLGNRGVWGGGGCKDILYIFTEILEKVSGGGGKGCTLYNLQYMIYGIDIAVSTTCIHCKEL